MNQVATLNPAPGSSLEDALRLLGGAPGKATPEGVDLRASLPVLLRAMRWQGRACHLAESLPHFCDFIGIDQFEATLANLGYRTIKVSSHLRDLEEGVLPCLFVDSAGKPLVVLARSSAELMCFDPASGEERLVNAGRTAGHAYLIRSLDAYAEELAADKNWLMSVGLRFGSGVKQVLFVSLVIQLLSIVTPLYMMGVYDTVIPSGSESQLTGMVAGAIFALTMEWLLRRYRSRIMAYIAGRIDYLIGFSSFNQVIGLPLALTENEPIGAQISHLQEFESIREFFAGALGETMIDLPFSLVILVIIASLSGWLAMVPLAAMLLLTLAAMVVTPHVNEMSGRAARDRAKHQRFLIETLSGMRAIRFSGADDVWQERLRRLSADAATSDFRVSMLNSGLVASGRAVVFLGGAALIGLGSLTAMNHLITTGTLIACVTMTWTALSPFQAMLVLLSRGVQIRKSIAHVNRLMRMKPERRMGQLPVRHNISGRVSFNGVSFRHASASDPALSGVSFSVNRGEVVAITGPNGAGKTTVLNLICGLYRPQVGTVLIDGVDIRQMDPRDIRQRIGFMPQSSELIYGTIAQNLRLSVPTATEAELREAAETAGVLEAIEVMPDGFETRLNEKSMAELPEGLKQKLSFARALLRRPPILIFDEPGQMVDESGDKAFHAAVRQLRGRATIIIVTHRPSHMRLADKVIVMRGGRVVMSGPSAEVMQRVEAEG